VFETSCQVPYDIAGYHGPVDGKANVLGLTLLLIFSLSDEGRLSNNYGS